MKADQQSLNLWFEENKTQPFTTRDGLGIPTMPLVSTQAVGVEQDTSIHKPAMPPRTFSIADDRIFHYLTAVPATAEGDIEVHGLSLLIAQLLQPSGESPFTLALGPNEDALPAKEWTEGAPCVNRMWEVHPEHRYGIACEGLPYDGGPAPALRHRPGWRHPCPSRR